MERVLRSCSETTENRNVPNLSSGPAPLPAHDTGETDKKIAQALQDEWKKTLGITIDIRTSEWKVFNTDVQSGKYDFGIWLWGADFNDPINFLEMYKEIAR